MVRHLFLNKTNTIIEGENVNLGLNPVAYATYGNGISRFLVHFNTDDILSSIDDKTFADTSKLSYKLHMTNCTSINGIPRDERFIYGQNTEKERATSFTLIAMKLPYSFDEGRGFETSFEPYYNGKASYNENGCNWYRATNEQVWDSNGIYSDETIQSEYDKFNSGLTSLVVASQHFDFGDTDLDMDITKYIQNVISGDSNNGLCIMFTPSLESSETEYQQYVGFFTDHTNTFYHPYIEINYDEHIDDNRANFYSGRENKLYFYSYINGVLSNLDENPTCYIENYQYPVKQATKGVYYATVSLTADDNTIHYDKWSNLKYNGTSLKDQELEFVVLPQTDFINVGLPQYEQTYHIPSLYGINDDEIINRGDIRAVTVDFREKFSTYKKNPIVRAEYRMYVKEQKREIDITQYLPLEKTFIDSYFNVYTEDLIPNTYYVDIKVYEGKEVRYYKEVLRFNIVNNTTKKH